MAFDWEHYIDLADVLIKSHSGSIHSEACLRAAISRSYYGVFIPARRWYARTTGNPLDYQKHRAVIGELKKFQNPENLRKIGRDLERLLDRRCEADYESEAEISLVTAKDAHTLAKKLYGQVQNLLAPRRF